MPTVSAHFRSLLVMTLCRAKGWTDRYAVWNVDTGKASPYSITERRVAELIPVEPASDVSHKPGGRLPLLSARPEITIATLKTAATNFAAW